MIEIEEFIKVIINLYSNKWLSITLEDLAKFDGRSKKPHTACTSGSFIYIAYENNVALYVGETSKSIKRRFITDGSGSHKQKNSIWYARVTKISYIKMNHNELPDKERKLLEQAFSIHYNPEFYG